MSDLQRYIAARSVRDHKFARLRANPEIDDFMKKIDNYFDTVSDEQFLRDLKAAGFVVKPKRRPWWELILDIAAWLDRGVWRKKHRERRPSKWEEILPEWECDNIVCHQEGTRRWIQFDKFEADGWRPARYI